MRCLFVLIVAFATSGSALDWVNTGDLVGAEYALALVDRPAGGLYVGAIIDTSANDSGAVFYSTDFVSWQRCGDIPGDQGGVYGLLSGVGDTLFAGSNYWNGAQWLPRVYRSADAGSNWTMLEAIPTPVSADRVWALLEPGDGSLVAGVNWLSFHSSALPARSTDGGQSWTIGTNNGPYRPISEFCLLAASDGALYVGTWAGERRLVYRSTDNGVSWIQTDTMYDSGQARALAEDAGGVLYAGTYPRTVPQENIGRVFRSANGGTTWQQVGYGHLNSTRGIRCLLAASDGVLYAGTTPSGEVFSTADSGNTWVSEGLLAGASVVYDLLEVEAGDSTYLYAATGPNGDVFRANLDPPVGVEERKAGPESRPLVSRPGAGVVLDAVGRTVAVLPEGVSELPRLAPGVYFVIGEGSRGQGFEGSSRKVVVQR